VLLSISLILLDHNWSYFIKVRRILNTFVSPIHFVVDLPIKLVKNLDENLMSHRSLMAENENLKLQQLMLQVQIQRLSMLEKENQELRDLVSAVPKTGQKILVAQVLSVGTEAFKQEIVINRGNQNGVYAGQAVLDSKGIMGQVIDVSEFTSRVMLLSDRRSGIPVMSLRSGFRGIAIGEGEGDRLELINIPMTADIKVADLLVSSGLDQHYPSAYPVGIVTAVIHKVGEPYLVVDVKSMAAFQPRSFRGLVSRDTAKLSENSLQDAIPGETKFLSIVKTPPIDQSMQENHNES